MAGEIQPLDEKFAIVGPDGRPTLYFIKWCQSRQIDITEAITLLGLEDYLDAHPLQEGSGIQITPGGSLKNSPTIAADAQEILDQITTTRGSILYRNASDWVALAPGNAGDVLESGGAGADPAWAAGGSGGGVTPFSFFDGIAGGTLNINSTTYIAIPFQTIWYDVDTMPFTDYRVIWRGASNAGGATCSFKMHTGGGTALAAGDDLTFASGANQTIDSGWKPITASLSGFQQLNLFMKGSTATVDMAYATPYYIFFR